MGRASAFAAPKRTVVFYARRVFPCTESARRFLRPQETLPPARVFLPAGCFFARTGFSARRVSLPLCGTFLPAGCLYPCAELFCPRGGFSPARNMDARKGRRRLFLHALVELFEQLVEILSVHADRFADRFAVIGDSHANLVNRQMLQPHAHDWTFRILAGLAGIFY